MYFMLDKIYYIIYSSIRKDPTNRVGTEAERAAYLLELILLIIGMDILMIGLSAGRLQVPQKGIWIIMVIAIGVIIYFVVQNRYIKNHNYKELLSRYGEVNPQKRVWHTVITIFLFLGSIISLFLCGVFSQYLRAYL